MVPNVVRSWEWEPGGKTVMHFVRDAKPLLLSPGHYLEQIHAEFQDADKLANMANEADFNLT